ncbi:Lrp/AsnC family transcriptional regulator [Kribbella kalugense]|uniref:DNA-binding Lrp family transcriptional regulator n=1 Tax=Kribbella kalugense TaxID=2512221 RepID=A0A4R7ZVC7_9ACTN|nr:Lrp/AsnC family transcriptional regulator [Kribbella kalugense]TDW21605.1 DNA-binding Lrp family transcriptional regulator [Kribbella kalugense]
MMDAIDRALIHALQLDGRAPYSRIGEVLGVSTQTVARRFNRLRAEAGLRVVGLPDPQAAGRSLWLVRLTAAPQVAQDLAAALSRRSDTSWIKLASGGTEIEAIVTSTPTDGSALLLNDIPRTTGITSVSAHYLLHMYVGGPTAWRGRAKSLTPAQAAVFRATATDRGPVKPLGASDGKLLAALAEDGRATHAELAGRTGWAPATVARRMEELQQSGAVYFDVDVDPVALGFTTSAMLWLSVPPAHLDAVGRALAEHDELGFVAATTGRTNLVTQALCASPDALHTYLTQRIGAIEHITAIETVPILRTVKAAAPFAPGALGLRL